LGNVLTPPEDLSMLEALRKELEDAKKKIAEQEKQLAAKDAEITVLKRQAVKDAEEIKRLKKLLADREREIADLKRELEQLSGNTRARAESRMTKDVDKDKELAHLRDQLKHALAGAHGAKDAHAAAMAEKDREIERLNKLLHDLQEKLKRALLLGKHPIHQLFELRPELNFKLGEGAGQSLKILGLTNQWANSTALNAPMERMLVGRTVTSIRGHAVRTAEDLEVELTKYSSGDKVQLEVAEDGVSGPKHRVEVELGAYGVPADEIHKLRKELGVEASTAVWARPKEWHRSLDNFLHPFAGLPELPRAPTPEPTIEDLDKEPCMHRLNRMSRAIFAIEDEEEVKKQVRQEMPESFNLHLGDLLSGPNSDKEQLLALKVLNSVSEPMKRVYRWYMAHGIYNMDRTTFLLTHGQLAMCLTDCKCSPGVKGEIGAITKLVARARNPDGSVSVRPPEASSPPFRFDRKGQARLARSLFDSVLWWCRS
jgi:predicted  nucleic acid-binding Zn-ribbon protein